MDIDSTPPHRNGTVPVMTSLLRSNEPRPTIQDLHDENNFYAATAQKHWLNAKRPPKVKQDVVKELWDHLAKDGLDYNRLLLLEMTQILEKCVVEAETQLDIDPNHVPRYLWPGFTEDSSNQHLLLAALILNVKRREGLASWVHVTHKRLEFSSFFRRVLSMTVDMKGMDLRVRTNLLSFIIGAFHSIDNEKVVEEIKPLVSIGIWQNLHSDEAREEKLNEQLQFRKAWRAAEKKFNAADEETKVKMAFDRSWLFTLIMNFIHSISLPLQGNELDRDNLVYCERFLELLIDLQSQLPTRRYVNTLIQNVNLLHICTQSQPWQYGSAKHPNYDFRDLVALLHEVTCFPIDDMTGQQLSVMEQRKKQNAKFLRLQRLGLDERYSQKLGTLIVTNHGSLKTSAELDDYLKTLTADEDKEICDLLGLRTEYPPGIVYPYMLDREGFYHKLLLDACVQRPTFQEQIKDYNIVPTERSLYAYTLPKNADLQLPACPLALPKLNVQYLSMADFFWRSLILDRGEAYYGIRSDVEVAIKRMQPRMNDGVVRYYGVNRSARTALPISKPAIIDVGPVHIGEFVPSYVRSEVILDVSQINPAARKEWESLKPGDTVFLATVRPFDSKKDAVLKRNGDSKDDMITESMHQAGLRHLRSAEVIQIQDEKGRPLRDQAAINEDGESYRPRKRRLILNIDPVAFQSDRASLKLFTGNPYTAKTFLKPKEDIYDSINVIIRRHARENNFRPILETIKRLALSDAAAPSWLQDVFLGHGDPSASSYKRMSSRLKSIDFRDTFLDWQHLIESLPGKALEPSEEQESSFSPPYVLDFSSAEQAPESRPAKKRKRKDDESPKDAVEAIKVSTYKPPNNGPYPMDLPKLNKIRFTPAQIDAITSGTQPGLTVIVGPPGTGKTDVATQIINNIYHNFPSQRTLLIAHSNQALNQLFQKIVTLDIDERHLLRLGRGEEELETDASFSKYGRVESFMERGAVYLAEVTRLAASINAPGAHGNSCETADYFNQVYIKPLWTQYWDSVQHQDLPVPTIIETFPFQAYFSNAPQPLFPEGASREEVLDIIQGCYRHITRIFSELASIQPFEVLRSNRAKQDYLLTSSARIVAMTATHAAMRRQEIVDLGFKYDNVIIEESAQITEIETFIPLAMQKPKDGDMPLKRVILVGDHFQNSPIIQSLALRDYCHMDQSMFLRFVRLGVPTITLDKQGRARASLAELVHWRYPTLGNLPNVLQEKEFLTANAGFRYEYQFIDVQDYQTDESSKAVGESEPSPHFIQNLGEAEFAVAIYQYMRLLGYPAEKITILAAYAGQRALIRDILAARCRDRRIFGYPRVVTTVDKYQGEQNDYVILSLVRTARPGYLRDLRRLTVALSRARLGLYVLGRREMFESCYELRDAFEKLFERPTKLELVTSEMWPTERLVGDQVESTPMEDVLHMGQYVYEMTKAKIELLRAGGALPPVPQEPANGIEDDEELEDEEDDEQDIDEEQMNGEI